MSEKKEIARIGNFSLTKEEGNGHEWISIKAISGFWTLRFRDDNSMFHFIIDMVEDKSFHDYLEAYIKMCYVICNTTPDLDFMGEFFKSYSDYQERVNAKVEKISDEEDAEILEEERVYHEMKDKEKNDGK